MLAIRIALLKSILFVYRAYKISCSGKKVVDKSQSGWYSLEAVSEGNKKPEKMTLLFTADSYLIFKEVPLGFLFIGIVHYI